MVLIGGCNYISTEHVSITENNAALWRGIDNEEDRDVHRDQGMVL